MRAVPFLIALGLLPACVGTEVGNPQDAEVTVEFTAEVVEDPRALTLSNGVDIDEAWMSIEEVGLRETAKCEDTERIDDESPFAVELLSGVELPEAPMLVPIAAEFCRLELELESAAPPPTGAPEALSEGSIFLTGTLEDGTPFEVRAEVSETIRLDGPFSISGRTRLLVAFDINTWVEPTDFDELTPDADGVLRLSAESDGSAVERISDAVRNSGRLIRDNNQNGVFDAGDDVVATSATETDET